MNKTIFRLLVFLMSLSLIGIILVQLYLINASFQNNEEQFKHHVKQVIGSVSDFNIPLMIPTAIGILIGLLVGAYLVRTLMEKVPCQTYGAILGLIVGSIFTVFPLGLIITRCTELSGDTFTASLGALLVGLLCCVVGFFTSYLSSKNS